MRIGKILVILMLITMLFASSAIAAERVGLGFLYGSTENVDLIDRTNGAINQVSPTCFDLDSKGNLVVTENLTHSFVNKMHERNVLVTPFLSNHWARQKGIRAVKNAEKLSDQIVAKIIEFDLDGVNVDIENLTETERDALSEFVRILREKMPEGKILSVSVAANPTGKDYDWQGSYDYQKLGEYADYLFVMTYDEHSISGPQGPVASNSFVEESIKYALQFVSKDKIVMGVPFYGRYWKNGEEEGQETGGQAIVIGAVPNIISKHNGIVEYDNEIGETKVTFSIDSNRLTSKINGDELEDGNYTIWYQTNEDIKSKLALVNEYDLLGCGVWALGQEKVEVWDYFKTELNKIPREEFCDAQEVINENEEFLGVKENYDELIKAYKATKKMSLNIYNDLDADNMIETEGIEARHIVDKKEYKAKYEKTIKTKDDKKENNANVSKKQDRKRRTIHRFRMEKVY